MRVTEIRTRIPRHASSYRVAEVLADLDLLDDDSALAIRSWADHRTSELPAGFASAVRDWLLVLLDGDSRAAAAAMPAGTVAQPFVDALSELVQAQADATAFLVLHRWAEILERCRGRMCPWRPYNAVVASGLRRVPAAPGGELFPVTPDHARTPVTELFAGDLQTRVFAAINTLLAEGEPGSRRRGGHSYPFLWLGGRASAFR
ncbi:hypothetical protein OG883_40460 [Streptomyces sp. NBC_01142]|uniref:hypothetical protein n=1 Tax=Streptomyces sp. NBC_01142 TaxID=2975865 RepID=UPI00225336C0|nr:hypothetical protein [Streptomyces sp. NBC_01142]MCX4825960.1 hypothetical protein [Streptomyces sp. NBC_01142]